MNKALWSILVKAKAGYHCAQCGRNKAKKHNCQVL